MVSDLRPSPYGYAHGILEATRPDVAGRTWSGDPFCQWLVHAPHAAVERLAEEVARLAGETKTEAIRRALAERRQRLVYRQVSDRSAARARAFLEHEVWPEVPKAERGRRLTRSEEDEVLGYGEGGA